MMVHDWDIRQEGRENRVIQQHEAVRKVNDRKEQTSKDMFDWLKVGKNKLSFYRHLLVLFLFNCVCCQGSNHEHL